MVERFSQKDLQDQMSTMLPSSDTEVRPEDFARNREDNFTAASFAEDSWQTAKERFMDAGKIDVDPDDPALFTAYKRSVDYFKDVGLSGLELADAAFKYAVGTVSQVMPTEQQEKRMARDLYSMPEAFMGAAGAKSLTQLDDAVDLGVETAKQYARNMPEYDPTIVRAGFTGQNPPTYQKRDKALSQQGDVELDEFRQPQPTEKTELSRKDFVVFRDPIKEFAQTVTIPKKGLLGSEFLNQIKKNESTTETSLQEGIIDPTKRYTREELVEALGGTSNVPGKNTFSSIANIASDKPTSFSGYQRQKQVGFKGIGTELNYFEIPIDSNIRGKGKPFKATSQHFNPETIAHVRGSIVEPKSSGEVPTEYHKLIGTKPFMLIEELQSDLITKGYVKPGDRFEQVFHKAKENYETMFGFSFEEAYGDAKKEIKEVIKYLDENDIVNPSGFGKSKQSKSLGELRENLGVNSGERGFVIAEDFEEYLYALADFGANIDQIEFQARDFMKYQQDRNRPIFDIYTGQEISFEDFLTGFKEGNLKSPEERRADFLGQIQDLLKKKKIDDKVTPEDFESVYESFKYAEKKVPDRSNIGLPPIRKNKQAVEEALKVAITKAAKEGVTKIVIPPASRIAVARDKTLSTDKGDRFYRTYVMDLNKALEDLKKNYPVKIYSDVELPYEKASVTSRGEYIRELNEESTLQVQPVNFLEEDPINVDGIDLNILEGAIDNYQYGDELTEAQQWHFDTFLQRNNLTENDEVLDLYNEFVARQMQEDNIDVDDLDVLFKDDKTKKDLTVEGTIIDISELVDQYQVEAPRQFAEGGAVGNMRKQMSLFEQGGITDGGVEVDPVSGNEVPPGSLPEEVRDDIPAMLSEGEYVVPADVLRYYGVKFFEDLRNNAKMGLTEMEADGRIGGEPVMNQEITEDDLAALDQMLATGAAEGGLMDKLEYVAKNDPQVNQRLNQGGMVVGFAEGGMTQSLYSDPNQIDQVISKVMTAARQNPKVMEQLSSRGIQVNRTEPQMQPQEMDQANPMSETRKAFFQGGVTGLPMAPQQPMGITPNMSEADMYRYITSPTTIDPMYNVPGGSYIGAGVETPTNPTASTEYCASLGMAYDAEKQMCVPKEVETPKPSSRDDDDTPIVPTEGDSNKDWFTDEGGVSELNFSDPESIEAWAEGLSKPMQGEKLLKGAAKLIGGPLGLVGAAAPQADALADISSLRAASIIAKARGDTSLSETLDGFVDERLKSSGKLSNMLEGVIATGNKKAERYAQYLGFEDLEDMSKEENKEKLKARTRQYTVEDLKQDKETAEAIKKMSAAEAKKAGISTAGGSKKKDKDGKSAIDKHWERFKPATTGTATVTDSDGKKRTVATYDPDKVKEISKTTHTPGRAKGGLMTKRK